MNYLDSNKGDCCLSDEKSLKYCTECECKEPGKDNFGRTRIPDSSNEEPPTGLECSSYFPGEPIPGFDKIKMKFQINETTEYLWKNEHLTYK